MTTATRNILDQALRLRAAERVRLIGELIDSLDEQQDADAQAAWEREITRRVGELDAGTVKPVSWTAGHKRLRGMGRP